MVTKPLGTGKRGVREVATMQLHAPELVFGIVGPIGVDLDLVISSLQSALSNVQYASDPIHITEYMKSSGIRLKIDNTSYYNRYKSLISYANEYRKKAKHPAALAGLSILRIRECRRKRSGSYKIPSTATAYIIRQFKRDEEIDLMRNVYGRRFIQISVFSGEIDRRNTIANKIRGYDASPKTDELCESQAMDLIAIDYNQKENIYGQRISDVFCRGDVFVDGTDESNIDNTIRRFINALFGDNQSSPTKDEYAMYTATAAALRSVDLSRQVGAAIFTKSGEVISMGCNEVPKSGGGTYWCDDKGRPFRDVELKVDRNHERRNEILYDLVERLKKAGFLKDEGEPDKSVRLIAESIWNDRRIKDSQLMDIIEFGRMIHAEMSAITDAARIGIKTKGAVLFCTTFPCHLCAKHIVAAGIDRVVFLEPYPKSWAMKLHHDSITFETEVDGKVLFEPFIGISPRRYRDIFEKKKRKDKRGKANIWYEGIPAPRIEDRSNAYIDNEGSSAAHALGQMYKPKRRATA